MVRAIAAYYAVQAALQWVLFALIYRHYGSTEAGRYSVSLALISPMLIYFVGGLRQTYLRSTTGLETTSNYYQARLLGSLPALTIAFVAGNIFFGFDVALIVSSLWVTKTGDFLAELAQSRNQLLARRKRIITASIVRCAAELSGFFVGAFVLKLQMTACLFLVGGCSVAAFLLYDVERLELDAIFSGGWACALNLSKRALTVGSVQLLDSFSQVLPRLLMAGAGYDLVAKYSAVSQLLAIPGVALSAVATSVIPALSLSTDRSAFTSEPAKKLYGYAAFASMAVSVIMLLGGGHVLGLIYSGDWDFGLLVYGAAAVCGTAWYLSGVANTLAIAKHADKANVISAIAMLFTSTLIFTVSRELTLPVVFLAVAAGYACRVLVLGVFLCRGEK